MKKNYFRIILFLSIIAVLFIPALCFSSSCNDIRCSGKISMLYPHGETGIVYIEVDADTTSLNCTLNENKFLALKDTSARFREIYSLLLASSLAERDVVIRIKEGTSDCEVSYVQLIP